MLNNILQFCGWTLLVVFGWALAVRILRKLVHFPMPEFMAGLIDNPWRHVLMPPAQTAARHALQPGMTVLEIGPGNGTYSVAAARGLLPGGRLVSVDIEPKMLARLQRKAQAAGLTNVEMRLADVCHLPYEDGSFDAIFMIAVIGELPDPHQALLEFHRVLKEGGTLALSELLPDPDYSLPATLERRAAAAGFTRRTLLGNLFYYTLVLEK